MATTSGDAELRRSVEVDPVGDGLAEVAEAFGGVLVEQVAQLLVVVEVVHAPVAVPRELGVSWLAPFFLFFFRSPPNTGFK